MFACLLILDRGFILKSSRKVIALHTKTYIILCMTKFQKHLKQLGIEKSSETFHISKRTALAYIRGDRVPRLISVPSLIRLSKGNLTYSSFFLPDEMHK